MAKIAFLFPGQGSQKVGMGKAAYDTLSAAKATFDAADQTLGFPLSKLCFEGPEAELQLTANTQPAILTASVALWRCLDQPCDMAAGHSLGEYAAHVAAGTLSFETAVSLVRTRGTLMQEAVPVGQGAMAAVLGGQIQDIEAACRTAGAVQPVNYNCPGQVVIAGEASAVAQASQTIKALGAKLIPLSVSAPFHSPMMRPAEERLAPHLAKATFANPRVPVYANVDAQPVTIAAQARERLEQQVSRPVRWQASIEQMIADGATLFVEIGPGKALTGMLTRIAKEIPKVNVESPADFDKAREAIAQHR